MMLSWNDITAKAMAFSKKWKDAQDEFAEAQSFLNDFFDVFGVDRKRVATFEKKVTMGTRKNGYIDMLWKGVILVEMKSIGKDLDRAYTQANEYAFHLGDEELPEYIMVSDFRNIRLYRQTTGQVWNIQTKALHKHVKLFSDLAGYKATSDMPKDKEVDIKAAEKMAKLHDVLKSHGYEGHELEVYLVRLLFCLFADDTGIFEKNIFFDYISASKEDGTDLSLRIAKLFEVLDMPPEQRIKQTLMSEELKRFEYINGKLFSERLSFADFDYKMRKMLLECCTLDWGYISPAIFGSIFQGVMNPIERRELGAHYTSEENIKKLIKPLFLDELWEEFEIIKGNSKQLQQFHEKLSRLKFLDPACGCGNFLIITYREIRLLELEVLKMLLDFGGQLVMDISSYCKINVDQFYGIEIEEFPSQIAQVGMWLMDHQMNTLVAEHFGLYYARLPLKQSATIVYGNALTIDWESVVSKDKLSYILGNPPFSGARRMSSQQKNELREVFNDLKNYGNLDYVTCWFAKAAELIKHTRIKVAFVSTNSIVQGEQVPILWYYMNNKLNIDILFAYRTFVWANEAKGKAAVHCVIIAFQYQKSFEIKHIYISDSERIQASNINGYLLNAPNIYVESKTTPICDVLPMNNGNNAVGSKHLFIEADELNDFLMKQPDAKPYIKKMIGARNFIDGSDRYVLWFVGADKRKLVSMPEVMNRIKKVEEDRLSSDSKSTRDLAENPFVFRDTNNPQNFLVIPANSSGTRKYIPIAFFTGDYIPNNKVNYISNANLYYFGILTSSTHMAWLKTVGGKLKSDFNYSKNIVYNNFPWPEPSEVTKEKIEQAAQGILDARALYSDWSLADLYDKFTMPIELVKAHNNLDRAVVAAYGGKKCNSEAERVADLMERYQELVAKQK